ncbi:putative reverse transcriptase domain-containing protein [Tanacetum coccineum]
MNSGDVLENTSSVSCKGISSGGRWMSKCFSDMNGDLQEEVFVSQPEGFEDQDNPTHVIKEATAISTTEAEYFAMSGCCAQIPLDEIQLNDSSLLFNKIPLIKGVKKEALHTLRQKSGQYICCQNHKLIADIEDDIMDPVILRVLSIILVILPEHLSGYEVFTIEMEILLEPTSTKIRYLKDGNGDGNSQFLRRPHKGVKASANSDVMYFFTSAQDGDPSQDDVRLCLGDDLKKAQDHSQRQAIYHTPCPCTKCLNHIEHKVEEVQFHLFRNGIDLSYTNWTRHGEKDEPSISAPKPVNATTEFVDDTDFASDIPTDGPTTVEMVNATKDNFDEDDLVKFQELLLDAEKPLYEGCPDFTKLFAIVKLLNLKGYKKIHVCINNCLLYWKDDKDLTACRTCGVSRWKVDNKTHKVYENIPAKAWRTIDEKFPEIAKDPRNLRLGISADGVDINTGNRHHSVWPILTVIYNLPP